MPKLSLVTCTGARPDAFSLCEKYIENQSILNKKGIDIEWIVVDDCTPETKCSMGQKYVRGPRKWEEGLNTQRFNMEEAIKHITGDYVFVIEDDERYSSKYLETFVDALQYVSVVGIARSRYYGLHVPGWKIMQNDTHSSLSQTAFKKELLPVLKASIDTGQLYFDIEFWKKIRSLGTSFSLLGNCNLSTGIKGMPGRAGITESHRDKDYNYEGAPYKQLHSWLGEDAKFYYKHIRNYGPKKPNLQFPMDAAKRELPEKNRGGPNCVYAVGEKAKSSPGPVKGNKLVLDKLGAGIPVGDKGNMPR